MGYVMVPVPEEHVEEAMEAVLRITRQARLVPWDQDSVDLFFAAQDESAKALLSLVARATIANRQIAQAAAADRLEVTQREILGIVRDVNHQAHEDGRAPVLLVQEATETLPNGRTRPVSIVSTNISLASLLQAAEQGELTGGGQSGSGPVE
ncbi:MAG: hypothetical protein H6519_01480 [Microthrixaceae bacterium]|nr:hypothetical protein [Acidimicrobiales bacterium]MCB9403085.1 hypothetical protein [Microthrixaceae bacterium]